MAGGPKVGRRVIQDYFKLQEKGANPSDLIEARQKAIRELKRAGVGNPHDVLRGRDAHLAIERLRARGFEFDVPQENATSALEKPVSTTAARLSRGGMAAGQKADQKAAPPQDYSKAISEVAQGVQDGRGESTNFQYDALGGQVSVNATVTYSSSTLRFWISFNGGPKKSIDIDMTAPARDKNSKFLKGLLVAKNAAQKALEAPTPATPKQVATRAESPSRDSAGPVKQPRQEGFLRPHPAFDKAQGNTGRPSRRPASKAPGRLIGSGRQVVQKTVPEGRVKSMDSQGTRPPSRPLETGRSTAQTFANEVAKVSGTVEENGASLRAAARRNNDGSYTPGFIDGRGNFHEAGKDGSLVYKNVSLEVRFPKIDAARMPGLRLTEAIETALKNARSSRGTAEVVHNGQNIWASYSREGSNVRYHLRVGQHPISVLTKPGETQWSITVRKSEGTADIIVQLPGKKHRGGFFGLFGG